MENAMTAPTKIEEPAQQCGVPAEAPVVEENVPSGNLKTEGSSPTPQDQEPKPQETEVPAQTAPSADTKRQTRLAPGGNVVPQRIHKPSGRERLEAAARAEVEAAKDPSVYETYAVDRWNSDPHLWVYSARRRGRGHIQENTPCQDYCLTAEGKGYIVMAGSDGVSACKRSDVGSRLACEAVTAVVQSAAETCPSEEKLVNRLCSRQFRERLVKHWIKMVFAHYKSNPADSPLNPTEQLYLYGATLMFVVITPNWYVAGNLGDGQILFFNDEDAMKLRIHPRKESSKTFCLVNSKCYLENFQVKACPRNRFSGILLTTDGIYSESFGAGQLLFQYAKELKNRFLEKSEPYLPFCYQFEDGITRDMPSRTTHDDCTIVLALDDRSCLEKTHMFRAQIGSRCQQAILQRIGREATVYAMMQNQTYLESVILPEDQFVSERPQLTTARMEQPLSDWNAKGYHYAVYPESDVLTLEYLYCVGKLCEQAETVPNASLYILELYRKLRQCDRELQQAGLMLSHDAHFLVGLDKRTQELVLRPEALCRMQEGKTQPGMLWRYFDALLGMLTCESAMRPVFSTGFTTVGLALSRIDGQKDSELCYVENVGGENTLKNSSPDSWRLPSAPDLAPGARIPLVPGTSFMIKGSQPGSWVEYRFVAKEDL